jgi:hypothetical protein
MAIFGNLDLENKIQVSDKTRLDGSASFISKDEASVTLVEIEPEAASGFIDVTGSSAKDWFLDWEYSGASRTVTVSVRITTDGAPVTFTDTLDVITVADDTLFSSDGDLIAQEHDILNYVRDGRNSFLNVHRKAQTLIMDWLNDLGAVKRDGTKFDKDDVVDIEEVRKWSESIVLEMIFQDLSNAKDDVFGDKSRLYAGRAGEARNKSFIRLDTNDDGIIDLSEGINIKTIDLSRT